MKNSYIWQHRRQSSTWDRREYYLCSWYSAHFRSQQEQIPPQAISEYNISYKKPRTQYFNNKQIGNSHSYSSTHPAQNQKQSQILMDLPSGSPILLYRPITKKWDGPFKFISVDKETAVVQLRRGQKIFRTSSVNPGLYHN